MRRGRGERGLTAGEGPGAARARAGGRKVDSRASHFPPRELCGYDAAVASEKVLYAVDEAGVATLTLNEPETRNALSGELLGALTAALERAREAEEVRCVVLASSHEKVFSSGANLGGFAQETPLVAKHMASERFLELVRLLGALGKPP